MTTWQQFKEVTAAWVAAMANQPVEAVCWNGEARPVADPLIVLSITSDTDLATRTHEEYTVEDGQDVRTETLEAMRDLTVQVRVETVSQTNTEGALQLTSLIRLRTISAMFGRILEDAEIGNVNDASGMSNFSYVHNGVTIHARSFDVFLRFIETASVVDRSPEFFDSIDVTIKDNTDPTDPIETLVNVSVT